MLRPGDLYFDAASGLARGRRERQEDTVAADFPVGAACGFAVLADGMGGHDAGDLASQIVVTEMFSELKMQMCDPDAFEGGIAGMLRTAMNDANACINHVSRSKPGGEIMGATLLAPILFGARLYWVSVGDSPLFLFRDGKVKRLNEDHSMGGQIDAMLSRGLIGAEEAANHPDRNCLTSVLIGEQIPRVDCTEEPFQLEDGDIVIAASDGLEVLSEARIGEIVAANQKYQSSEINAALLREIELFDDPEQDNVSLCVIKLLRAGTKLNAETHHETEEPVTPEPEVVTPPDCPEIPAAREVSLTYRSNGRGRRVVCVKRKRTA